MTQANSGLVSFRKSTIVVLVPVLLLMGALGTWVFARGSDYAVLKVNTEKNCDEIKRVERDAKERDTAMIAAQVERDRVLREEMGKITGSLDALRIAVIERGGR
jgi:hypothetical protein